MLIPFAWLSPSIRPARNAVATVTGTGGTTLISSVRKRWRSWRRCGVFARTTP